ncbi:MAG: AAA family ATPase, partial [Bacteroidales bacterium]|nr:AAA family ATPase [Bacteroidales bacterium]
SNAGAERIIEPKKLGFASEENEAADYQHMKDNVMEEVKRLFRPEFINRIDEIITFHELTPSDIRQIVLLQIGQLKEKMASMGITIEFTEDFIDYLSTKGYDPAYGARPVKRVLQRELIDELAKKLLDGSLSRDSVITATFRDGKLALS